MKELFLKTENGNVPIEQTQVEKYNLKAGNISPNNGYPIVDKKGKEKKESTKEKSSANHSLDGMNSEGIIFTTAEIIDISQGADS